MRYSSSALVLAAATLVSNVLAGPVVHNHGHQHVHAKKDANVIDERDLVVVYKTVTKIWGEATAPVSIPPPATTTTPPVVVPTTSEAPVVATSAPAVSSSASSSSSNSNTNIVESAVTLASGALSKLLALGVCQAGVNANSNNGNAWIGNDGSYTMEFINSASEDIIVVLWGPDGSWVNVKQPYLTLSLAQGASKTVSFADGFSMAFSAVYDDTTLVNGQLSNTWGECTMSAMGVCDVSREVNMQGHNLSIVGPDCTSDMETCVFKCSSGNTCMYDYVLENCAAGSQVGAQSGVDTWGNGGASGGCGWSGKTSVSLTATWS